MHFESTSVKHKQMWRRRGKTARTGDRSEPARVRAHARKTLHGRARAGGRRALERCERFVELAPLADELGALVCARASAFVCTCAFVVASARACSCHRVAVHCTDEFNQPIIAKADFVYASAVKRPGCVTRVMEPTCTSASRVHTCPVSTYGCTHGAIAPDAP